MNFHTQLDKIIHSIQVHQLTPGGQSGSDIPGGAAEKGSDICVCHASYTILYFLDGACDVCIDSRESLSLSPSDLLLLPPGTPALFFPKRPAVCLSVQLNPAFLLSTLKTDTLFSCCLSSPQTPALGQMSAHLLSLSRLYLSEKEQQQYQILSHLYSCVQILHALPPSGQGEPDGRSASSFQPNQTEDHSAPLPARFLEIADYISKHIDSSLTLQDTAAAMNLTPQYLASCFQKSAGCTFMAYVSRLKARASLPWLTCTELPDSEISAAMGFRNTAAFQKCILDQFRDTTENIRKHGRLSQSSFSSFLPHTICEDPLPYLLPDSLPSAKSALTPSSLPSAKSTLAPASLSSAKNALTPASLPASEAETSASPPSIDIHLSLQEKMDASWKYVLNVGFASQLTDIGLRSQIQDIQTRLHFRYGRICRLLDLTLSHQINGKDHYSFEIIFQTLDFLLSIHLIPFLELGFKREKIHSHFTETYILSPEKDILAYYDMLLTILPDFIRSCCNRYGQDTVSQWYFEIYYDEIDNAENNMELTFGQYADYYKQISSILRAFVPECHVGGTGFNTYLELSVLEQELCTLRSMKAQLHFFSIYVYGGIGHSFDTHLTLDQDLVLNKTCQAVSLIHGYFPELPVLVTEFSFCYSSRNYLNDSLFQSSFIIRYLARQLKNVQGIGYFSLSDLNVRYRDTDEIFFGGNGLYNIHGIRKPSYYAYDFFNNLGHFLLGKGEHYIFTANSKSSLQGILFHYVHIDKPLAYSEHAEELLTAPTLHFQSAPAEQMSFTFRGLLPGSYIVKRYRITEQAANPLKHWPKYRYFRSLSEKDLKFFRYLSHPETDLFVVEVQKGEPLRLSIVLEPQEVQLLLIDLSPTPRKEASDEI